MAENESGPVTAADDEPIIAARQIAMGHGMVDVSVGKLDGRYALVFRERDHFISVGEFSGEAGDLIPLDEMAVVIWLDGPEFGQTIINTLNDGKAAKDAE